MVMLGLWTLSSCNQEMIQGGGYGLLSISLDKDLSEDIVTKAGEELVFSIDVLNDKGETVAHADDHRTVTTENPIELRVGTYTVVAESGEDLNAAFENPYYKGSTEVKIHPAMPNVANITCSLANTIFSVEFLDDFSKFSEYEVSVTNGIGDPLVLSSRPASENALEAGLDAKAYFAVTGSLEWTVTLVNTDGGRWSDTVKYSNVKAGQHYNLKFTIGEDNTGDGAIALKVTLEDWADQPDHDLMLDFSESFGVSAGDGFAAVSGVPVSVTVGDNAPKALSFSASEGIRSLSITHSDNALADAGLPQNIELVGATADQLSALSSAGVVVTDDAVRSINTSTRNVQIDLTGLIAKLAVGSYSASFNLVDNKNNKETFKLVLNVVMDVDDVETVAAYDGWANFAMLEGRLNNAAKQESATFQYRKSSDSEWIEVNPSDVEVSGQSYSVILGGLEPSTDYVFRAAVSGEDIDSRTVDFATAGAPVIHNLSFDDWTDGNKFPNASGYSIWDSANSSGAATTTSPTSDAVSGNAAKLESVSALGMMAAGNIFTGEFLGLAGLGARLSWGTPFEGRPLALRGYYKYSPVAINKVKDPYKDLKGQMDQCQILISLTDWDNPFEVNTKESTFVDFDNDSGIVAFAQFNTSDSSSEYIEFILPLVYRSNTRIPKYLIIAGASSRYGDYFTGGIGSELYIDEFELVYDPAELTEDEYNTVFSQVNPF